MSKNELRRQKCNKICTGSVCEKYKAGIKEIKEDLKDLEKQNDRPCLWIVKVQHNKYANSHRNDFTDLMQHQSKPQQTLCTNKLILTLI